MTREADEPGRPRGPAAALAALSGAAFELAPKFAAGLAFLAGAAALIITVSASPPAISGLQPLETVAAEWPDFVASVAAVWLMALAVGLRRRIDTAWAGGVALLAVLAVHAGWRLDHMLGAASLGALAALLALSRRAFFRHGRLSALAASRRLHLAIAAALMTASLGGLLWAGGQPGFAEAPWWALLTDASIGRPGRSLGVAAAAAAMIVLWQGLIAPARPKPRASDPQDLARARAIAARAQDARPETHLFALGDKAFVFTPGDSAFVMAARWGGSFIAMGGPIGARAAWREALLQFRTAAETMGLRPVIYAAAPDVLPELLDAGFSVEKIGETAVIALKSFSLAGKAKQDLRSARRRLAEREGAVFAIERFAPNGALFAELRPVSQSWLESQKGGEKGFSLGRYDAAFLEGSLVATVRTAGSAVAFATLWTTPDGRWAAIDLMRYDPARAPRGLMDFLITETLLWAQREGFEKFDLGLAPLSGLSEDRNAPLFAKFGRLVYERGGALYNFEGLRRFKEKFGPDWEPRYLAAPGAFALPIALAEVALLTSGGALGLVGARR